MGSRSKLALSISAISAVLLAIIGLFASGETSTDALRFRLVITAPSLLLEYDSTETSSPEPVPGNAEKAKIEALSGPVCRAP